MANGDEGISIPAVPKPIVESGSENEMPEAPSPTGAREVKSAPPVPSPVRHVERMEHVHAPDSPPLFIKVDKYNDVVENLGKLKSFSLSLRDALDALADIEKELTTGLSIAHKALDEFNTIISILDSKLLKMDHLDIGKHTGPKEMDSYVRNIYSQMDKIKQELHAVSEEI